MPRWLQLSFHAVVVGAGAFASYATTHAMGLNPWVGAGIAVAQGVAQTTLGGVAQSYNTNGTPQSQPYPAPASPSPWEGVPIK